MLLRLSIPVLGAPSRRDFHTCAGLCALVANVFEHQINKVVDHDWRGAPQRRELMSALNVSPALLVELDCVGFATNLFASLLAVFVVVDPPHCGHKRVDECIGLESSFDRCLLPRRSGGCLFRPLRFRIDLRQLTSNFWLAASASTNCGNLLVAS